MRVLEEGGSCSLYGAWESVGGALFVVFWWLGHQIIFIIASILVVLICKRTLDAD